MSYQRSLNLFASCLIMMSYLVSAAGAVESSELATNILRDAGIKRGICVVVGGNATLPLELARSSELLIHCRQPDREIAAEIRALADRAGLGIDRLAVDIGPLDRLPYADRMIDLLIAPDADRDTLKRLSCGEVLRVLRPQGRAIIGNLSGTSDELTESQLRDWKDESIPVAQFDVRRDGSTIRVEMVAAKADGAGDWSHWEHSPDNNPVSEDAIIKAPYMTQFMAKPYYIAIPSITTAAAGRTFLAIGHIAHHRREWDNMNRLVARNGYNGTVLWQRDLPEGYLVHRSAFIAMPDTFYMIEGDHALMLDPETGETKGRLTIPGVFGDWKWMAIADGVLYALAGKQDAGVETTKGDREYGGWSWADSEYRLLRQASRPLGIRIGSRCVRSAAKKSVVDAQ